MTITKGNKEDLMFTIDMGQGNKDKAMYVTYDKRRIGDLDFWHKRCGHMNVQ